MRKFLSVILIFSILLSTILNSAFAQDPSKLCFSDKTLTLRAFHEEPPYCRCKTCEIKRYRYDILYRLLSNEAYELRLQNKYNEIWFNKVNETRGKGLRNLGGITDVTTLAISLAVYIITGQMPKWGKIVSGLVGITGGASFGFGEYLRNVKIHNRELNELEIKLVVSLLENLSIAIEHEEWKNKNYLEINIDKNPSHPKAYVQFLNLNGLENFYLNLDIKKTMEDLNKGLKEIIENEKKNKYNKHYGEVYNPWWNKASDKILQKITTAAIVLEVVYFCKTQNKKPNVEDLTKKLKEINLPEDVIKDFSDWLLRVENLSENDTIKYWDLLSILFSNSDAQKDTNTNSDNKDMTSKFNKFKKNLNSADNLLKSIESQSILVSTAA